MRQVTRPNGIAVVIAPIGGGGQHVFRPEAARLQSMHDIPDEHVILFDHNARPPERYAFTCAELRRIARSLPPGFEILTVFVLRHGYAKGGQEGIWTHNVGEIIDAAEGRLARDVNWVFFSCSNAATIGHFPDGDMSLADAHRDALCARGYVDCMTYGHTKALHATRGLAEKERGQWVPLARWFWGHGSPTGGTGGTDVLPKGHPLLDDAYRLMRKSVDLDGDDGPEPMSGFRFAVPFFESQEEFAAAVQRFADVRVETGHEEPSVLELQTALAKGGYDPGDLDGVPGRRTTSAVKAFQLAHPPLVADGIPGPTTWRVLRAAGLLA